MVLELLTGLVPWWLPWGACSNDWVLLIFIQFLNENFWSNEDLALAQGTVSWHCERAHVAYSWGDKRCVGTAEDTQPSESTGWLCRTKACTPAALLGDNRSCSQNSAGTVSWTQLTERFQKRAREWVKLKSQSWLQCPRSFPGLFSLTLWTYPVSPRAWSAMQTHSLSGNIHSGLPARLLSLGNRSQQGCRIPLIKWADPWQLYMSLFSVCNKCKESLSKPQ